MTRLIVQACAILFITGIFSPKLFALGFNDSEMFHGDQHLLSASVAPDDNHATGPVPNAWATPSEPGGNTLDGNAAAYLFGTVFPGEPGTPCSIDWSTMCITSPSRIYPVTPNGSHYFTGDIMSRIHEASCTEPLQVSLVITGLALVAIAFARKRMRLGSPDLGKPVLPSAQDSLIEKKKQDDKKGDKTRSLAA